MKALLPDISFQRIVEGSEAHSDVVRHVCAYHCFTMAGQWTRVVDRVAEAVRSKRSFGLKRREVPNSLMRLDHQRQRRRVRSYDQLFTQPTLEREIGTPEAAVLIRMVAIANVVS